MTRGMIELMLPRAEGLRDNGRIEACIVDMRGRQVWKSALSADAVRSSNQVIILKNIHAGSYIAAMNNDGVIVHCNKIVAP